MNDENLLPPRYRAPRADRPRWHGRDLPRRGRRPGANRRDQGARRRASPTTRRSAARFTREALAAARGSRTRRARSRSSTSASTRAGPYIVMEYLPGGSLADRLDREGAQPLGRVARVARPGRQRRSTPPTRAGIVHRDVKPANLLLDDDDRVKVADFGVASAAGLARSPRRARSSAPPGYLAPEQARGENATPASDRYALAVVAFELLTGTRPFERESSTAEAMAHVSAPIPPASSTTRSCRPRWTTCSRAGSRRSPGHRYGSCADFVHALRDALDRRRRDDHRRRAAPGPGAGPEPPLPVALAVLGALLLAGVLAAALLAGDEAADHPADGQGDGHARGDDDRADGDDRGCADDRGTGRLQPSPSRPEPSARPRS